MELGLAGQSLRLEWSAGTGSCVLLPRDARHCRAFLEELTGERVWEGWTRRSSFQGLLLSLMLTGRRRSWNSLLPQSPQ